MTLQEYLEHRTALLERLRERDVMLITQIEREIAAAEYELAQVRSARALLTGSG